MWVQLAIALVVMVIGFALQPKAPKPKPASIQDLEVPTAEEGRPIPVLFGTKTIQGPNVIGYWDLSTKKIKKGGK